MMSLKWRKRLFYILLPLLAGIAVFTAKLETDISAFFIAGDSAEEILLASEMQSGTMSRRYVISIGSKDFQAVSVNFINAVVEEFKAIDGVVDVWKPGQQRVALEAIQSLYIKHSAHLFSRQPEADLQIILSEQGLDQAAAHLKKALLSPQAALFKKIALQDPLLLSLRGFKSLAGQAQEVFQHSPSYQNLILETSMPGLDYVQQVRIQQQLENIFTTQNGAYSDQYDMKMTGVPVYAVVTRNLIEGDIEKISIVFSIALTLLFFWIFRSVHALFLVASILTAVVAISVLVTMLVFGHIHGMTMAIGTTLIGICIDFPIHALVHGYSAATEKRTQVIAGIWPSMLMGGATTLVGYLALGLSGYPGFQQISVYAGTGIIVSLFITRYVLPALMGERAFHEIRISAVNYWARFCRRFRRVLLAGLILSVAGSIAGLNSLQWLNDLEQLTPELEQLKVNDKLIRSRMISSMEPGRFILVRGSGIEDTLQKAEQIYSILDQLKIQGKLDDYFGLYPWLLSEKQQKINQQSLKASLTKEKIHIWKNALKKQGLSVERLGALDYSSISALLPKIVIDSPVNRLIGSQIIANPDQTLILIWLARHEPEVLQNLFNDMSNVRYFSQRDLINKMAGDYRVRAQKMLAAGLVVIFLLLFLRYRNLFITLQTLLPAILAAFFILAGWSLSGEAISFLHLVGFLLAVAICVDYGIFYRENRSGNITLTYQAMAASMLTSVLAFGSLAVAHTSSLRTLASVVAIGVFLGFLLCPVIIKQDGDKG